MPLVGLPHAHPVNDSRHARVSIGNVSVSLPADAVSVVLATQPVDQRFKILEQRACVKLSLSRHELHRFTPRSTGSKPQN